MSEELSRRNFIASAGAAMAAGPAILPALGANGKLNAGFIGTGGRGYYLMERMYVENKDKVVVTAVCDAYQGRLAKAKERVQTTGGNTPKTVADYHEILNDPSIDIVFIATPEHLHFEMAMAALAARKNIYLEKPLAHTIEEGAKIVEAAKVSGKIVQVGTQNRSNTLYLEAKRRVEAGMIGEIHYVRAFWYRNALDDNAIWRYEIPAGANEQNTDWKAFLGKSAPKRPFSKERFYQWRCYSDYSSGISTDLLVHQTDITNFVCGRTFPGSCMASGGIYRFGAPADDREVPDCISAIYEYPESRFHLNYSSYFGNERYGYGEQFMGNEGTIEVLNRQVLNFYPETFRGKAPAKVAARRESSLSLPGNDNKAVEAHISNLVLAVMGQGKVIAPPEVGQQAAIGGHMATLSYRHNKKIYWDATKAAYHFS